jgi:hypothetical protein
VPQGVAVRIRARAFTALLPQQLWRSFSGGHRVPVAPFAFRSMPARDEVLRQCRFRPCGAGVFKA